MSPRHNPLGLLIWLFSLSISLTASSQTYSIRINGSLPSEWINNTSDLSGQSLELVNVSQENLDKSQDPQTYKSQQFINFMQSGGITLTAINGSLPEFINSFVSENEYEQYLEYYRKSFKSRDDYIKEKYGELLPSGIKKIRAYEYPAYFYHTTETDEEKQKHSYTYFILIDSIQKKGVVVSVKINYVPEKRNYTPDSYQKSAETVLALFSFSALSTGNVKKEIRITGELSASQALSPPARAIEALKDISLSKWFQRGAAVSTLTLKVSADDKAALPFVTVSFTIDPPSKITGPGKRIRPDEKNEAITTFDYTKSDASGQGGPIFARAQFPEKILLLEDGTYKESESRKQVTIQINPVCDEFLLKNMYFKDNLISDVTYTEQQLQNQLLGAIKDYKTENNENPTATWFWRSGLLWFLGNHGGEALGVKIQYYTGNEIELSTQIINSTSPQTPGDVFRKALELNKGDVNKALLACHNVIRASARGAEDFSGQLTESEKTLIKKPNYRGLSEEEKKKKYQLEQMAGRFKNSQVFEKLAPMRKGDNMGAWYHFFATSLVSFNNHAYSGFINGGMSSNGAYRNALDLMIWTEENLVSGDIYSDPNEYCIDHYGLKTGDLIAQNYFPEFLGKYTEIAIDKYLDNRKKQDGTSAPLAVGVFSPVSIKVTDNKTGANFHYDASTGNYSGNLAAIPWFEPEANQKYYHYILLLPNGDYKISCEAIDSGNFTFYTYDFNNNKGGKYDPIKVTTGEKFTASLSPGNISGALTDGTGKKYSPQIVSYTDEQIMKIRAASQQAVIESRRFFNDSTSTVATTLPENNSLDSIQDSNNIFLWAGIIMAALGIIILAITKKKWMLIIVLIGIALSIYGYFASDATEKQPSSTPKSTTEPTAPNLDQENNTSTKTDTIQNILPPDEEGKAEKDTISNPETPATPTESMPQDLLKAYEEKEEAYRKYTRIATGEANGDIESALKDYKEKYYAWKSLMEKYKYKVDE